MPHNCLVCGAYTEKRNSKKYEAKRVCNSCGFIQYIRK